MRIRKIIDADLEPLLALNNEAVPSVNELEEAELRELIGMCSLAVASVEESTVDEDTVVGMLLALAPGTTYESTNYAWFSGRYTDFVYLDRIVVDSSRRGAGIGARLHEALAEHAQQVRTAAIALEVNLEPPNPGSIRFHHRLGFSEVGQLAGDEGKLVSLMMRQVS